MLMEEPANPAGTIYAALSDHLHGRTEPPIFGMPSSSCSARFK
jgi:hypothetical protein